MKKVLTIVFSCCLFVISSFSQERSSKRIDRQQMEEADKGAISKIPACFCCSDSIYSLPGRPTIAGEDLICKAKPNIYSTSTCAGAQINWSVAPAGISFSGQGSSQIQIDYSTVPDKTPTVTICAEIKCGNKVVKNCRKIKTCQEQKVTVTTGQDAMIHCLVTQAGTNYGTFGANLISNWTFNGTAGIISSVLKFDFPVPLNPTLITKAELFLYDYCAPSMGGANLYNFGATSQASQSGLVVRQVTTPWSDKEVSCNSNLKTTNLNEVLIAPAIIPAYTVGSDNQVVDVTAMVKAMATSNYGFMIQFQDMNANLNYRARSFGSFDCPVAGKAPRLVITY